MKRNALILVVLAAGCAEPPAPPPAGCLDKATVISTAAGSPSAVECLHGDHVMEATMSPPMGSNVAALVICRCRDGGAQPGGSP